MSQPQKTRRNFGILVAVMQFDTQRRFDVLREEIKHLIRAIDFRIKPIGNAQEASPPGPSANGGPGSSRSAFLHRLKDSALCLQEECQDDLLELERFQHQPPPRQSSATEQERQLSSDCFVVLWNAKAHEKALLIAERLGELQSRFEQFLQRSNPTHATSTARRRAEQGLIDKYLSEFTRWVHRDLALFSMQAGARYPYRDLPSTYQFWGYQKTSRQHSFTSLRGHIQWRQYIERESEEQPSPRRFTALSLSYWIPERLPLVPIIGHELAHQLLRDIYGREVNFPLLEQDGSDFASLYRGVTDTVEAWLWPLVSGGGLDRKMLSSLAQEIVCDLLAAVRFGYAFAYAWALEMLADERFANLFHDQYGMMRRLQSAPDDQHAADPSIAASVESLREETEIGTRSLKRAVPGRYYRGSVMLSFLRCLKLECDELANELSDALAQLLDVMLELYSSGDMASKAFHMELAHELSTAVNYRYATGDGREGHGVSKFLKAARAFWDTQSMPKPEGEGDRKGQVNPSLDHQLVNADFRQMIVATMSDLSGERAQAFNEASAVRTLTDVTWRLEWAIESRRSEAAGPDEMAEFRNRVRTLNFLAMDDYMVRTANQARLFGVLAGKEDGDEGKRLEDVNTNHLNIDSIRNTYDVSPVIAFDRKALEAKPGGVEDWLSIPFNGQEISIKVSRLSWLDLPILRPDFWTGLINGGSADKRAPPLLVLELMRLRRSRIKYEMNRVKLAPALTRQDGAAELHDYTIECSDTLLGRYDAFALSRQVRRNGNTDWELLASDDSDGGRQTKLESAIVSRSKRLVPVRGTGQAQHLSPQEPVLALILVSLKWDASRAVVARWLSAVDTQAQFGNSRLSVFLSDGWDDLVVFVGARQGAKGPQVSSVGAAARDAVRLIGLLNASPFVSSTETLFTAQLLQDPPPGFRFRFGCNIEGMDFETARTELHRFCDRHNNVNDGKLTLTEVAGTKDFEVLIETSLNSKVARLHNQLHKSTSDKCRVETRVAWPAGGNDSRQIRRRCRFSRPPHRTLPRRPARPWR